VGCFESLIYLFEGEIIVGITARSILEFLGIPWNYLELFLESLKNLHKIPTIISPSYLLTLDM
jgi:hypothetical protein